MAEHTGTPLMKFRQRNLEDNMKKYQLDVRLADSNPSIWRQIIVSANVNLHTFHRVLQVVMGWEDCHMHQFVVKGKYYGVPGDDDWGDVEINDEKKVALEDLLKKAKDKMIYEYDFGDGWIHEIKLEKIIDDETTVTPVCLAGQRACPPEDCGGVYGYAEMLETLKDPDSEEYEDLKDWIGDDFDPELFSIDRVNKLLKKIKKA